MLRVPVFVEKRLVLGAKVTNQFFNLKNIDFQFSYASKLQKSFTSKKAFCFCKTEEYRRICRNRSQYLCHGHKVFKNTQNEHADKSTLNDI